MSLVTVLCTTLSVVSVPPRASGGSGGGSTPRSFEVRVTGNVTAIDYVHSTITVGASYYGTGALKVTSSTQISLDTVSCEFSTIQLGDWAEARYDGATGNATKLACTSVPTS